MKILFRLLVLLNEGPAEDLPSLTSSDERALTRKCQCCQTVLNVPSLTILPRKTCSSTAVTETSCQNQQEERQCPQSSQRKKINQSPIKSYLKPNRKRARAPLKRSSRERPLLLTCTSLRLSSTRTTQEPSLTTSFISITKTC